MDWRWCRRGSSGTTAAGRRGRVFLVVPAPERRELAERSEALLATRDATLQDQKTAQQQEVLKLTSERDTEQALRRSLAHQAEQVKLQLLQAQQAREELRGQLECAQREKLEAEDRVARTRAMVSFRLGYTLLHGFGSFGALMKLPGQLWQLHREGQRQRTRKEVKTPVHDVIKALGSSTPVVPVSQPPAVTSCLQLAERPLGQTLKGLKVACIMDEFTFSSYAPDCNLLPLSVDHWHEELEAFVPELLFIESAWRGKDHAGTNGSLRALSTSAGMRMRCRCGLAEARAQ